MFLDFESTEKLRDVDGKKYRLQVSNVTKNKMFWMMYRSHKISLNKLVKISKIGNQFLATRWVREYESGTGHTLRYTLKNEKGLLDYQIKAVAYLCQSLMYHNAAIDASSTGIGKTYQALGAARELNLMPGVVCKLSGMPGWIEAFKHFKMMPLFIINWEAARTGFEFLQMKEKYGEKFFRWKGLSSKNIVIFDEFHEAGNWGTLNQKIYTASKPYFTLSASATPAQKITGVKTMLDMINYVDEENFEEWLQDFDTVIEGKYDTESLDETDALKRLNKEIFPEYGIKISAKDPEVVKHFPESIKRIHLIKLSRKAEIKQNKLYELLLRKAKEYREKGLMAEAAVKDLRYRQECELLKCEPLIDVVKDHLKLNHSVVVFVNFRESFFYLVKKLRAKAYAYGSQSSEERNNMIKKFQENKIKLFICTGDAGGASINLHDKIGNSPRVSLVCPIYSGITFKQILGRTERSGAKSPVLIKLIYAVNTIEEKVAERVNKRLSAISALTDGDLMEDDIFNLNERK